MDGADVGLDTSGEKRLSKSDGNGIMAEHRWPCGPGARLTTARSSDPISPTSGGGVCVREETRKDRNAKFYSTQVSVGNGSSRNFAGLRGFGTSRDFASRDFAFFRRTSRDAEDARKET